MHALGDLPRPRHHSARTPPRADYRTRWPCVWPDTRPLVAHCHLGLGKLYRRTAQREQAQEHLTAATTMYREMGMTYWLEKAEGELKVST